jgi:hypothetical protein
MPPSNNESAGPPKPDLAYAPAEPGRRRRRTARRVVLAVLVLAIAGCLWWWHEPLIAHGRLLYWQHKCQTHTFAPDAVVASSSGPAEMTSAPVPAYWTAYESAAGGSSRKSTLTQTVVFLHRRRSPSGRERVVAVRCLPGYLTSASVVQAFHPAVVEPAAPWPLTSRPVLREGRFPGGYPVDAAVRVFGGQSDAADPSHFTIPYTVNDLPGTLDGWLRDDDTVDLRVRKGSADVYPATRAPAGGAPGRAP